MHFLLIFALSLAIADGYRGPFRRLYPSGRPTVLNVTDDPGEPLFLTPYLEQGKLDEARKLRFVFDFLRRGENLHFVSVWSICRHGNNRPIPVISR